MTPEEFIRRWRDSSLTERAASHSHFNDLCKLLGEPSPTEVDSKGDTFAFEKGAMKSTGGQGWADVWKRGHFAWEYKQPGKDLNAAFAQLQRYAVALENPPLLIVSDRDRFRIHTNWTNTVAETYEITVEELRDANKRQLLKWAFSEPERLKPKKTRDELTAEAAGKFADLAKGLRERGNDPQKVAHFVNRLVFCMFAEDVDLLPKKMFTKMLDAAQQEPEEFQSIAASLFKAMRKGGRVGFEAVDWFNGGLFDDDSALSLEADDIEIIQKAADLDWAGIDPAIFGTLFERGLDPDKRSQLGAHYTDRDKIVMIIDPVIARPLKAEWAKIKSEIEDELGRANGKGSNLTRAKTKAKAAINAFLDKLKNFRVLDPACGSGNFLYLALHALKDLEHQVNLEAEVLGFQRRFPEVGPQCVKGIEINPFAAELARVSIWIGEIQWMRRNGFDAARNPILRPLDAIECRNAILNSDGAEGTWPLADAIVGNPPFLGSKRMRGALGVEHVNALRYAFKDKVPSTSDLATFWFEIAAAQIESGRAKRAGLVVTNMIRGAANRKVMERLTDRCSIFEAWSDEPWTVDGADVRVSLVCFQKDVPSVRTLDGNSATKIYADLSAGTENVSTAAQLGQNLGFAIRGIERGGDFDVPGSLARAWLQLPSNPNGRPNSDVLAPMLSGNDLLKRPSDTWLIDFGGRSAEEAAMFEPVFKHAENSIRASRTSNREARTALRWWQHRRSGTELRAKIGGLPRFLATALVSKHRLFRWVQAGVIPDTRLVVVARCEDLFFGILSSRWHTLWTLHLCQYHGVGNDPVYTPSTTFSTFPFPDGLTPSDSADKLKDHACEKLLSESATRLNDLREAWLNPAELVKRTPEVSSVYPDRLVPVNSGAAEILKARTLTNLYNEYPQWLSDAHKALDAAVAAAYGWPNDLTDDEVLARLFALNQERAAVEVQSN